MPFGVPGCLVLPKRLVSPETQRAVAIRALGWRLRVELEQTFRFGQMIVSGAQKALSDSRLPVNGRDAPAALERFPGGPPWLSL
jgi:hypothetical protein